MNEQHTTAKDFFIHLGALIALYVSVISLINLLFAIINHAFPDSLSYYNNDSYTIRWTISSLVILFPVYIYLAKKTLNNREFWVRRWAKYLTLFLTGGAVAGDLIVLINTFLGGEISIRFILKVVAVLIVAGFTFYSYVKEEKNINVLASIASLIVLASIVGGFFAVGSPSKQRDFEFDNRRVSDLQSIKYEIENYSQKNKILPESLKDIALSSSYLSIRDPETKEEYKYTLLPDGKYSYSLCATFSTVSTTDYWPHGIGEKCFYLPE